jgi:hypothetical protein
MHYTSRIFKHEAPQADSSSTFPRLPAGGTLYMLFSHIVPNRPIFCILQNTGCALLMLQVKYILMTQIVLTIFDANGEIRGR